MWSLYHIFGYICWWKIYEIAFNIKYNHTLNKCICAILKYLLENGPKWWYMSSWIEIYYQSPKTQHIKPLFQACYVIKYSFQWLDSTLRTLLLRKYTTLYIFSLLNCHQKWVLLWLGVKCTLNITKTSKGDRYDS